MGCATANLYIQIWAKTVSDNRAASQTTQTRESDNTSQTTPTRESDNRNARVRQQTRPSQTTETCAYDNKGQPRKWIHTSQMQTTTKKEHGINKACGTAVGKLVTCDPIIRSLATLLYSHLRLYSSRNLAIASDPIIRSPAALLMGGVGGEGEPGT